MILAWIGAAAVGLSLGLLGSGGAILTVPILVYLVGHGEKQAIAESFVIVGSIALVGALRAMRVGTIDLRSALLLAIPGIVGAALGVHIAQWVAGAFQLLVLAALMLLAAFLMSRKPPATATPPAPAAAARSSEAAAVRAPRNRPRELAILAAQGVGLGFTTGFVGVGGGFLIVPVLVLIRRLPMQIAVGTSLAIIAVNSATGCVKTLSAGTTAIDARVVSVFVALGIAGSLLGTMLAGRMPQRTLRRVFAAFLVAMACFVAWRQLPKVLAPAEAIPAEETPAPTDPRAS